MTEDNSTAEAEILQRLISSLAPLDEESRLRLLDTVARFFNLPTGGRPRRTPSQSGADLDDLDEPADESVTAKAFLVDKNPHTLTERVACLAFYLTRYRDTPHFKTIDISKLNTEAAQTKFSNTAQSVNDATKVGFLAAASKGNKQLSAMGEQYVEALPDREAARAVAKRMKPRKPRKKKAKASKKNAR